MLEYIETRNEGRRHFTVPFVTTGREHGIFVTMSREFKYDIVQLIEAVRDRPCIWDKSCESYKDRTERRSAWLEIFRTLDESFDDMTDKEEKRLLGERIINKWTNMRDTFVKSLKTRAGRPKRKYVLHKHLTFLLKGSQHEETEDYAEQKVDETYAPQYIKTEDSESSEDESYKKKRKKESTSTRQSKSQNEPEISEIDVYNDPRVMNEDEAFFASLLPSVVNYSEDERLEFRLEVLALMKRIKDKRNDPIY